MYNIIENTTGIIESLLRKKIFFTQLYHIVQLQLEQIPYSLKFWRGKYFVVLPNSAQKQIFTDKISWSNFQPRIAAVMNLKFRGRNFCDHAQTRESFQPQKF